MIQLFSPLPFGSIIVKQNAKPQASSLSGQCIVYVHSRVYEHTTSIIGIMNPKYSLNNSKDVFSEAVFLRDPNLMDLFACDDRIAVARKS